MEKNSLENFPEVLIELDGLQELNIKMNPNLNDFNITEKLKAHGCRVLDQTLNNKLLKKAR